MKYIVCNKPGEIVLKNKKTPKLKKNCSLIKIKRVGICGTDLHAYKGNQPFFSYPRILGHELAGVLLKVNEKSSDLKVGDKVVIIPYLSCGNCQACNLKLSNCCEKINVIGVHSDGGLQEIINIPNENLISENYLSFDEIALVEPLSIGYHAIKRSKIKSSDKVLVVGCGPIGIGIISLAIDQGCKVSAIDKDINRIDFVKKKFKKVNILNYDEKTIEKIKIFNKSSLCDVVFDATGNKKSIETSHRFLRYGGKVILVGIYKSDISFFHPDIHKKEIEIICSRNATKEDFRKIIKFLKNKKFESKSYITERISFKNLAENFENFYSKNKLLVKAMINF